MEAAETSGDPTGSSYLLLPGPCFHGLAPDITQVAVEVKIQPRVGEKKNTGHRSLLFCSDDRD